MSYREENGQGPMVICPECRAESGEEAGDLCNPNEGSCPMVENGLHKFAWPTLEQFESGEKENA
jgi:hypothetical protein